MTFMVSVPYIQEDGYLDKILQEFGNRINEIYMPLPSRYAGSGRSIFYQNINYKEIVEKCHSNDVEVDLLMNSSCEGLEPYTHLYWDNINPLLKKLVDYGIDTVTISNPLYIQKIKKFGVRVKASVISRVNSVQKAMLFQRLGIDAINLDRDINRNIDLIKRIKNAVDCELHLLVNEGCLLDCPFKHFHDNSTGHLSRIHPRQRSNMEENPFADFCSLIRKRYPEEILKSPWIRPEDLKYYNDLIDGIKIAGRDMKADNMFRIVNAYTTGKYEGNFLDLLNVKDMGMEIENQKLDGFFEGVLNCNKDCKSCNYCEEFAKRVIQ